MSDGLIPIVSTGTGLICGFAAAVCDVRTRRIPNRLLGMALATAIATQMAFVGGRGVEAGLLAAVLAAVPMLIGYAAGGVGAGDVKLMAVLGAFAGVHGVLLLLLATALGGGVFALLQLARRAGWLRFGVSRSVAEVEDVARAATLPYAVAICCGAFAVFCDALGGFAL